MKKMVAAIEFAFAAYGSTVNACNTQEYKEDYQGPINALDFLCINRRKRFEGKYYFRLPNSC